MQIKRLRLSGFKSFVDAADLRIEPGLTGIVGPNGCGKSNLLEALRWTMGEASARSLRGAGMDDVIFAGTATRPARDFAEVSMLIDEAGVEQGGGEVEVVRRIERGAGSAYRLNGRDVRAKDVALLFADAATGAHSPALVSQGRISAVIAAKPGERRAMLEEAAGIAGLHVRRKDAEARLRATEANLQKLDELIAEQGARVVALRRQARLAERYRKLSDEIRVAEARLIWVRWRDAAAAAGAAQAEAGAAEAMVAAAARVVRKAEEDQAVAVAALVAARDKAMALRDRAGEAGHRLTALGAQKAAAERRNAELADAAAQIARDRAREDALAHDAARALARGAEEAETVVAAIASATARLPALAADEVAVDRAARDAEVALARALAAQAAEAAEIRVAQAALATARARLDRAQRDAAALAVEAARLAEPAPLERDRASAAAARDAAMLAASTAASARHSAEVALREAESARGSAQAKYAASRAELAALEGEAAALEKAVRRSGRDRLLDHVTVAAGFERALAAALDDDLEVGLDPAAERHWAGAEPGDDDPAGPPGAVALAMQVTAPAALARRLAQIFVVAADGGEPLAVGQRLVTRKGRLRRWDGLVARTGGAAAAERLARLNRLSVLQGALPTARGLVEEATTALASAEAAIATARAESQAARLVADRAEQSARTAARDEDRAASALERLAGQRDDLARRTARLTHEHDEATADLDRAQAAVAARPDDLASRARVADLQRVAEDARLAVATARAERGALDRALAADRERGAALAAEASGWRARAAEATRRLADLAQREAEVARERNAVAARPAALAQTIATLDREHATLRAAAGAAAAAEQEADIARRRAEAALRTAAESLAGAREARAGALARAEAGDMRRTELARVSGERFQCPPPLLPERTGFLADTVRGPSEESARHERLVAERERLGPVNLIAESELAELEAASSGSAAEREELGLAVARLRGSIGALNREGRQRLLAAFEAVNGHFGRLFTTLFNGGTAHLALIDSDDPLEAGLEIMAQPPGKRLQSLTLLSGGEQALTAVALIFGLFLTSPAPICVLDEVDAPLDDANVERFCDLLDQMTRETRTRYLIVTHNAVTMSRMHRLFGVTMIERGVSRLVSVDLGGATSLLAAE